MAKKKDLDQVETTGTDGAAPPREQEVALVATPPNFRQMRFLIRGDAPLVQHRFGAKARGKLIEDQGAGSTGKKGKKREPKDFDACYEDARHVSTTGWDGIHAAAFRHALIDACKLVGFFMTRGKLALFILADGFSSDGTPLVRITKGEPRKVINEVRNATGVIDLRARPMWDAGWEAIVTVSFDADMFTATDVFNLLLRAGLQCGICEGRANSKDSVGTGWGSFTVVKAVGEDEDGAEGEARRAA